MVKENGELIRKQKKHWVDAIKEAHNRSEVKKRDSDASTKHWLDSNYRERTTKAIKIGCNTPEVRKKHSESALSQWSDLEHKKSHSEAIKIGSNTPEAKKRKSDVTRERWLDPDYRKHVIEEIRSVQNTPEYKKHHSEGLRRSYEDLDRRAKQLEILRNIPHFDTKPEIILQGILDDLNILYKKNYRIKHLVLADIFIEPNIDLEADGCWYHKCPTHCPNSDRRHSEYDSLRDEKMKVAGYVVIRFWEHDLRDRPEWVSEQIKKYLGKSTLASSTLGKNQNYLS